MCSWHTGLARFACLLMLFSGVSWVSLHQTAAKTGKAISHSLSADADLQLAVQVERTVVQRGNSYAYSLTINNLGPTIATSVKLTSQLPVGMSYIIANPTQGSCFNSNGAITCNLGSIAVNLPVAILIGVTVSDRVAQGSSLIYTASVASEQTDPQPNNNQISVTTFVSGKATIAGRITDAQGKGLSNVTINVTGSASSSRTTDGQGNFLFDELASGGNYTLTPSAIGVWFDPPSRNIPDFSIDLTANFVANTCGFSVSPTAINIPSGGGSGSVTVTTASRCQWTASSQSSWISITGGASSAGSGQAQFNVASTGTPRTGRITVAGQEVVVYQVANSCPVPAYRTGTLLTQDITPDTQTFAADFNNDGLSELVIIRTPNGDGRAVMIYSLEENTNGWRLWSETRTAAANQMPAAADFNGDGTIDLLLVSSANGNTSGQLYLGNGRGGWDLPERFALSPRPNVRQIYTSDLNNDDRPDVVVDNGNAAFVTLSQAGNRYAAPVELNLGGEALLAIADFTGDGNADILSGSDTQWRMHSGGLPGTRAAVVTKLETPLVVYGAKDFTGDNRADLLVGKDRLADGNLQVMSVNSDGRFEAGVVAPLGQSLGNGGFQFFLDDFNSDARTDVMLMINSATRMFIAGDGAGRLAPPVVLELPFESRSFAAGNFTRDNSLDLFALGQGAFANQLQLYANTCGPALLAIYGRITEGSSPRGVAGATLKLSGNKTASATTDIGGYYEFNNLPARFGYVVNADSGEFEVTPPRAENSYLTRDQLFNFQARRRFAVVSSANYDAIVAPDSMVTIFGGALATVTQVATTAIWPETLGSVTVNFVDNNQRSYPAKLLFVSPTQINLLVPPGLAPGNYKVAIASTTAGRAEIFSVVRVESVSPGLFTTDGSGRGLPSAVLLRIAANGRQTYETVARYDAARNQFVAVPIDMSNTAEQVYVLFYGSGMRNRSSLNTAIMSFGGTDAQPLYIGAQGGYSGLDQVNVRVPNAVRGRGDVSISLTLDGKTSNPVTLNFK
ncbi:MAG: hypothetical protein HOP19_20720 [Acidobacteria bacterium]|nr:hypothetical protein [Acidobacteriota bacterium]